MEWLKRLWKRLKSHIVRPDPWDVGSIEPGCFAFFARPGVLPCEPGRLLAKARSAEEAAHLAHQFGDSGYFLAANVEGEIDVADEKDAWRLIDTFRFELPELSVDEVAAQLSNSAA